MILITMKNDVAFMEQNGVCYMAAIDAFESNNEFVAVKIHPSSGLPALVNRTSLVGREIQQLIKRFL